MLVGTDIIDIKRIERAYAKHGERFLKRFLREEEIPRRFKAPSIAGYWAAKEAVSKALGCGIGKTLKFHDIRLSKTASGQPYVTLPKTFLSRYGIKRISLSISHDGDFAIAVVVMS